MCSTFVWVCVVCERVGLWVRVPSARTILVRFKAAQTDECQSELVTAIFCSVFDRILHRHALASNAIRLAHTSKIPHSR